MRPSILRLLLGLLITLGSGCSVARAAGRVATCVEVEAPAGVDEDQLRKLVESELDRHPSHRAVTTGCRSELHVELLQVGSERYLTGQTPGQVPHRVALGADGSLARGVDELLQVVLHNDPVRLSGPQRLGLVNATLQSIRKRGSNLYRVGLREDLALVDGAGQFLPGAFFSFSREVDRYQVEATVRGSLALDERPSSLRLRAAVSLGVGARRYFSWTDEWSLFLGGEFSIMHQRFRGPRPEALGGGEASALATLPAVGFALGIEGFRTTDMRAGFALDVQAPLLPVRDDENEVIHAWVPVFGVRAEVAF